MNSAVEYRFGPYRFETATGRLYRDDDEVPLPPRAADLLEELLDRAGEVCTKEELIDAVWANVYVGEESLTQAVSILREALGDDSRRPEYVETIPRRGYRFIAEVDDTRVTESSSPTAELSRRQILAGGAGLGGLGFAAGYGVGTARGGSYEPSTPSSYQRLTFRRGMIRTARFAPDHKTVLYGALWDGDVCRIYRVRPESPESAPLSLPPAKPLAVSRSGELALALGTHFRGVMTYGTLARVPLAGGAPREMVEQVKHADWSPDGSELAVVRRVGDREQLEYPLGNVIAESTSPGGGFSFPRVSPEGDRVALFELMGGLTGAVATVDRTGDKKILSGQYFNVFGLAWNHDEIWYTAAADRWLFRNTIHAIGPRGEPRVVARIPGNASLHDIAPDGRVLLARTDDRSAVTVLPPGETQERDLSWLDASGLADISRDGHTILFTEFGVGGGPGMSVYVRETSEDAPAVRLADGRAVALSPDGRWALTHDAPGEPWSQITVIPTGPGNPRRIEHSGFIFEDADWLPDGERIVVRAREELQVATGLPREQESRLYLVDLDGGEPEPLTPANISIGDWSLSPDGTVVAVASDRELKLFPVAGGNPNAVPGFTIEGRLVGWIDDGLLVSDDPNPRALDTVYQIEPDTGRRDLWKEIQPRDPAGIMNVARLEVTPDGSSYGYWWHRAISDLYLVEGLS